MRRLNLGLIIIGLFLATATQAEKSLWGDIDQSQVHESVNVQGYLPQQQTTVNNGKATKSVQTGQPANSAQAASAAAAAVVAAPKTTTCDILSAHVNLDMSVMKSQAMQDALRNNLQFVPAQFRTVITSDENLKALYVMYRTQYMKTYCR